MSETIRKLGRRLRLGVIGGGPGSFIGEVHRTAARLDNHYEVIASVLSSDAARSAAAGRDIGIAEDRAYATAEDLFSAEAARQDGIDALAIMTPNNSHYSLACQALESGLDVICDKPMTHRLEDAIDLVGRVRKSGLIFCCTFNYTGYPMVRQAPGDGEGGRDRRDPRRPGRVPAALLHRADGAREGRRGQLALGGRPRRRPRWCWATSAATPTTWRASSPGSKSRA